MMFSLKAQKLLVESAFLDRRSVYFYPISMQKCSLCVYIGKYEKVKIFFTYLRRFFTKKRIRRTYMKMCASDSLGWSMVCCYFFRTGSQVRLTPNFLKIFWSTSLSMTVQ